MAIHQSALTRKLSAFVALAESDLSTLARFYQRRRSFEPGHGMIYEGQEKARPSSWRRAGRCHTNCCRRLSADRRLPDPRRFSWPAQRPVPHVRSQLRCRDRDRGVRSADLGPDRRLRGGAAACRCHSLGASRDEAMVVEHLVNLGDARPMNVLRIPAGTGARA